MGWRQRQRSLRFYLVVGIGSLLVLLLATFVIAYRELLAATNQRGVNRARHMALLEGTEELMTALVDQEVGLRGYLVNGDPRFLEPYDAGRRAATGNLQVINTTMTRDDREALGAELAAVERAIDGWQVAVATPQITLRTAGPLADVDAALQQGKARFDEIRVARAALKQALSRKIASDLDNHARDIRRINYAAFGVAALTAIFGLLLIRFVVRHVAEPLANLAGAASSSAPFPPPEGSLVREISTLSKALHHLDAAVRDREQLLTAAHGDAVALSSFGEFVQQLTDPRELHQVLARTLQLHLDADKVHVMVRNASHNRLDVELPEMSPEQQLEHTILGEPLKCRAVRTLRTVSADAGDVTACRCSLGVPADGGYLCVPMLAAGELVGLVNIQSPRRGHFTPELQQRGQGYTSFASTTLSSMRLLAATRERALRDPLTGAYNRGFLAEYLGKQLSHARRRKLPLAVLMLDLDHFKRLNDTHGHAAGDQALVAFVRCLQQQTRGGDAVVRYGGEEFMVVLLEADVATASAIAERIRAAVEITPVPTPAGSLGPILRCSIGLAAMPDHGSDEQALMSGADAALYRAKSEGRNRVNVALTAGSAGATPAPS